MRALVPIALCFAVAACQAEIGDPVESEVADGVDAGTDSEDPPPAADAAPPAPVPDAEPVDVPPEPDAAPDPTAEEQCTARYSSVPDFVLCEASDTCTFIAKNGDISCGEHCAARGGTCLSALDNDVGSCTDLESDPTASCATTGKIDLLCTCTR